MIRRHHFLLTFILLLNGCASLTTPSGGPKDLKPPRLISSIPSANQINFKGKAIELTFNEPVKLNNPREEIIISPSAGKNVEIKVKGTKVTIAPEKPWRDSTTYSIQFREAIQDITESNIPINLKLAFSTGPLIDTLHITGKIKNLLKGSIADKITVGLYDSDTFDIFTDTARYFTKTDKKGKYKLDNIKAGSYKIYAFDDKNKNLRVESQTERFGFQSKPILLQKNLDSLGLGLIMLDSRRLKVSTIRNAGTTTRIRFNKPITDYTIAQDSNLVHAFGDNRSEVIFWNPSTTGDSLRLHLTATDSLSNHADTLFYLKKTLTKSPKEVFKWSLGAPIVESETGNFKTTLSFNKPIIDIDFDSLYIKIDTASAAPPPKQEPKDKGSTDTSQNTIVQDSVQTDSIPKRIEKPWILSVSKKDITYNPKTKDLTIVKQLDMKIFKLKKDPTLSLVARSAFVYSIDQDTSKVLSTNIPILWPEDTGIVLIEVITKEKSFIIQLLDPSGKVVASARNVFKQTFKNLPPMDYQIRIVIDSNENGKWDPGNFYLGQEPEKVAFYLTPKKLQNFAMRANWENGPLVIKF